MNYGGFWIRFLAYVVDSVIVTIAFFAIVALLGMMGLELISNELILVAMGILYYAFMQASPRQATLGKALVGLKVTGLNGERIALGRALGREVAKIISTLTFLIGFIIAAFTTRKQALHDLIATTLVVRAAPGRVAAALAVALLALVAPFAAVALLGVEVFSGLAGMIPSQIATGPQVAVQAPPKPKPAAPAPAKPAPAVAKPVAVPASAPVVLAQATAETPKPAAAPKESARPVAAEPPKPPVVEAPKEEKPKPVARTPAPAAPPPMQEIPRPVAVPERIPAGPGPKYNDLMTAVLYRDPKAVEELLAFGKWTEKPDSRGLTPLMLAAEFGDGASAEALLKAGADPNRSGPGGRTATSIARERKDAAMLGLLQRYGGR